MAETEKERIESEAEVNAYIARLKYALQSGAPINIQIDRQADKARDQKYTNRYTIANLFPDENPNDMLRRELMCLSRENYIRTVKDDRFPNLSEWREFGKVYHSACEIYIKVRVEILAKKYSGNHHVFVMSFHYSTIPFSSLRFPYSKS